MRIDIDTCEEILITITRNKTRSLLTAFGVFWGIFMLVALIGGGQGMQEELKSQFNVDIIDETSIGHLLMFYLFIFGIQAFHTTVVLVVSVDSHLSP